MIIEEFGRCLGQIIEMANKAGAASNAEDFTKQFMSDMFGGGKR